MHRRTKEYVEASRADGQRRSDTKSASVTHITNERMSFDKNLRRCRRQSREK